MSWCKRLLAVSAVVVLASCGFSPLYGTAGTGSASVQAQHADVDIAVISDRDGLYLRNLLIDRLYSGGRPQAAKYLLKIESLKKDIVGVGIQKDATATRNQMTITSHMSLVDQETGKVVLERDIRAIGGYNVLDKQFSTLVSEQNITERILKELSDTVMMNLDLFLSSGTKP